MICCWLFSQWAYKYLSLTTSIAITFGVKEKQPEGYKRKPYLFILYSYFNSSGHALENFFLTTLPFPLTASSMRQLEQVAGLVRICHSAGCISSTVDIPYSE